MGIKNITFISLNYYPEDTAIGLYSTQWVDFLNENGYNVTVVTAFPYYPKWEIAKSYKNRKTFLSENSGNIKVLRYKQYVPKNPTFFKRILHLLDFTFGSFINLFKIKHCDLVISVVPFTTSIVLGYIQKKRFKAPLWSHVQDFEFDAAYQTGLSKKTSFIFKFLFKLEKVLFSKVNLASTISQNMLVRLGEKTKSEKYFLPNWIDAQEINPKNAKQHKYLQSDKIKILYSGNIGEKQDWDTFIRFCNAIDAAKYEIILVGDGSKKEWVCAQIVNFSFVTYYAPVPFSELSDLLCSTDIHILFQKSDIIDTVMPSKVLGMMASAKPSIIIGNENSEIKTIFEASNAGLFFSDYSQDVVNGLRQLELNATQRQNNGKQARDYVVKYFSKDKILSKMLERIEAF